MLDGVTHMTKSTFTRGEVADGVSETLTELGYIWRAGVDPEYVHLFDDLGLDSLDGFDMVLALEERFDASGSEANFSRTFTMRAVIETACAILRSEGRLVE